MNKTNPTRRDILAASAQIAGVSLLAGLPAIAAAQPLAKHTLIEPFDMILEFAPELNADVGGHFRANGLDIEITNARGTSIALQQVLARQASFTKLGGLDLMKAVSAQSTPIVSFGVIEQAGLFSVVSLKSAPVRTPADMRGKTIGVASIGGGTENLLDLMLNSSGIPKAEVPRQAIGLSPSNVALLKQGRVAAFFATLEAVVALRRAGEPVEVVSVDTFAPIVGGAYVATRPFLDQNPQVAVQFLNAIRSSVDEILTADPNLILDRIEKKYELTGEKDRAYRIDALKSVMGLTTAHGKQNLLRNIPALWAKGADLVNKSGIAKIADPTTLYTNKFVEGMK